MDLQNTVMSSFFNPLWFKGNLEFAGSSTSPQKRCVQKLLSFASRENAFLFPGALCLYQLRRVLLFKKDMDVSKNRGTPKSSILIGFSLNKPSILGYPNFWKHPHQRCFNFGVLFNPKKTLTSRPWWNVEFMNFCLKKNSKEHLQNELCIHTWNPNDLYFWRSTLQNKALSNQNKGHLGSRYIYIYMSYIYMHLLKHPL